MGLPWLGYVYGWLAARIFKQANPDAIAISIETGLQNTAVAIVLLNFSLEQPTADLITIVPVSVAIMTPVPLMIIYVIKFLVKKLKEM